MPSNDRRKEILDQPCAFKLVYSPEKGVNAHVIVQGPDAWHLFHGTCCLPDRAKYHATSKDLLTWTVHEPILTSGAPGSPDHNQLGDCTVIEHEGRWFMLYQAQPRQGAARRICLAVSEDLWEWRKVPDDDAAVFTPDPEWSGWCEDAGPRYCTSPTVLRHDVAGSFSTIAASTGREMTVLRPQHQRTWCTGKIMVRSSRCPTFMTTWWVRAASKYLAWLNGTAGFISSSWHFGSGSMLSEKIHFILDLSVSWGRITPQRYSKTIGRVKTINAGTSVIRR